MWKCKNRRFYRFFPTSRPHWTRSLWKPLNLNLSNSSKKTTETLILFVKCDKKQKWCCCSKRFLRQKSQNSVCSSSICFSLSEKTIYRNLWEIVSSRSSPLDVVLPPECAVMILMVFWCFYCFCLLRLHLSDSPVLRFSCWQSKLLFISCVLVCFGSNCVSVSLPVTVTVPSKVQLQREVAFLK